MALVIQRSMPRHPVRLSRHVVRAYLAMLHQLIEAPSLKLGVEAQCGMVATGNSRHTRANQFLHSLGQAPTLSPAGNKLIDLIMGSFGDPPASQTHPHQHQ